MSYNSPEWILLIWGAGLLIGIVFGFLVQSGRGVLRRNNEVAKQKETLTIPRLDEYKTDFSLSELKGRRKTIPENRPPTFAERFEIPKPKQNGSFAHSETPHIEPGSYSNKGTYHVTR